MNTVLFVSATIGFFRKPFSSVQIVFGYHFADNVGGATIRTNFNYTCLRSICVQFLRILFSSFGEEDFALTIFKVLVFWLFFHR